MFKKVTHQQKGEADTGMLLGILVMIVCLGAWFTHLYVCFTAGKWGFLIAGAIFFPIAIVHGFGIWLGIW